MHPSYSKLNNQKTVDKRHIDINSIIGFLYVKNAVYAKQTWFWRNYG